MDLSFQWDRLFLRELSLSDPIHFANMDGPDLPSHFNRSILRELSLSDSTLSGFEFMDAANLSELYLNGTAFCSSLEEHRWT